MGAAGLNLVPKSNLRGLLAPPAHLLALEADDPGGPVDILGLQVRKVGLGGPQVPASG